MHPDELPGPGSPQPLITAIDCLLDSGAHVERCTFPSNVGVALDRGGDANCPSALTPHTLTGTIMKRRELINGALMGSIATLGTASTPTWAKTEIPASRKPGPRAKQVGLRRLDDGLARTDSLEAVMQRNFRTAIEQNIALCTPAQANRLFLQLSSKEISLLGERYNKHTRDQGRPGAFLTLAAQRLNPTNLAKLIPQFGYSDVYAAATAVSAQKGLATVSHFDANAATLQASGLRSTMRQPSVQTNASIGMLDYTIEEIYLSFRTAPVGALTPAAAAYETATFIGARLATSFGAGYAVGTVIANVWSTNFPDSWTRSSNLVGTTVDKIGTYLDKIKQTADEILNASSPVIEERKIREQGHNQSAAFSLTFGVEDYTRGEFEDYGGDYECAYEWSYDVDCSVYGCR